MTPTTTNNTWFTSTSDKPYDRHYYTINNKRFDDYEHLRAYWFQIPITNQTVIVHDYSPIPNTTTNTKLQSPKGFN
ncbi:hypothetical protein C440309_068 [Synechococcus phage S-CAM4]|uniref:DUF7441 domain-containing protein n=1 Tax=Synechococcus phage S-CAM4 TaxID=1883367 RepID=A0A1D8KKV7_9CAUD|nr:hypothetical protein C440309_068 [Synechococcus phage S-CAM4]